VEGWLNVSPRQNELIVFFVFQNCIAIFYMAFTCRSDSGNHGSRRLVSTQRRREIRTHGSLGGIVVFNTRIQATMRPKFPERSSKKSEDQQVSSPGVSEILIQLTNRYSILYPISSGFAEKRWFEPVWRLRTNGLATVPLAARATSTLYFTRIGITGLI